MIFDFFWGELKTPNFFNPGSGPSTLVPNLHPQPQLQNPSSGEREFNNEVLEFRTFISFAFSAECTHEENNEVLACVHRRGAAILQGGGAAGGGRWVRGL